MSNDLITKIFNAFDPFEALPTNDPRYVEFSAERHSVGLRDKLAGTIRREKDPTCQLLSGHRGCGKTTELFRLADDLLKNEPRFFVVYCEADQYIDVNDVEYTDVLLAVVQQISAKAKENRLRLEPGKLRTFLNELWGILTSHVELKDLEIDAEIAKLTFEVKKNPNNRSLVRQHLRRATSFIEAVNEVIELATKGFQSIGYRGLAIIVDNLDRILLNTVPNTNYTSHEALFVNSSEQLKNLACHVIYTVPPALLYSPGGGKLPPIYGTHPRMLPMIPVTNYAGVENEKGIRKLREVVEQRLDWVGTTVDVAFDADSTIDRLCKVSGGYVRNLVALVRDASNGADDLPITASAVEEAIRSYRDLLVKPINAGQWQLLKTIAREKAIAAPEDCLRLLDNLTILEYLDDEGTWYDVSPVVREAREFKR